MSATPQTDAASRPWLHRRWRNLCWIALALCAIVLLRKGESRYEERDAPLLQRFAATERAQGRNFAVQIDSVKTAHAYRMAGDDARPEDYVLQTPGIWLAVIAQVQALQETGTVDARIVTRDGLIYRSAAADRPNRKDLNLRERPLAPGLPERGAFFFELPPDRLQGAHLQAYWGALAPAGGDSLIDIDLGIDAARAEQLLREAKPVVDLRQ